MNTVKKLYPIFMIALFTAAISACKHNDDPKPDHHPATNPLDSVRTLFTGMWKFQSVTVTQNSTTATTSNCARTQLADAGFTTDDWRLADEQEITFRQGDVVNYYNICTTATYVMNVTAAQNEDGTVNVVFTEPEGQYVTQKFVIREGDITPTTFKASAINTYAYTVVYVFERSK